MKLHTKYLFLVAFVFYFSTILNAQDEAYNLCLSTFSNTKNIKTLSFVMEKQERIDGKIKKQRTFSKLQRKPYLVYLKQVKTGGGREILYGSKKNEGKLLVNPNGFPWVNISLNPMSSMARKGQHHTIEDSGFDLVINILEFLFDKYGKDTKEMVSMENVQFDGINCKKITFVNPNFKYVKYKIKAGETLNSIAQKYMISEYMIVEKNKTISNYTDIKVGDEILIPNDYSPNMELTIDVKRKIPLSIKIFDDEGLYEYYKYFNVVINPEFTALDFDANNSKYGF